MENKLVIVRCLNCNAGRPYRERVSSHLRCPSCSGMKVSFNKVVERVCEICGFVETIGIGEIVLAYHQSGHHDCLLTIVSEGEEKKTDDDKDEIKEDDKLDRDTVLGDTDNIFPVPKNFKKQPVKKAKKRLTRKKKKSDGE